MKSTEFIHKRPFGGEPQFLKNGRFLVTSEGVHASCLWDAAIAKKIVELPHDPDDISMGMDVSPDGKWLAASTYRGGAYLYDRQTGKSVRRIGDDCYRMFKPCFTPNGKSIVTMGHQSMWVWDAATGQLEREIPKCRGTVAFSPDGMVMACADEDAMRLPDHHGSVNQVQFSPDGKRLFALCMRNAPKNRYECHVRVWDVAKRTEVAILRGRFSVISRMSLSPDGHALALLGGDDSQEINQLELIESLSGKSLARVRVPGLRSQFLLAYSPAGKTIAVGGEDQRVR